MTRKVGDQSGGLKMQTHYLHYRQFGSLTSVAQGAEKSDAYNSHHLCVGGPSQYPVWERGEGGGDLLLDVRLCKGRRRRPFLTTLPKRWLEGPSRQLDAYAGQKATSPAHTLRSDGRRGLRKKGAHKGPKGLIDIARPPPLCVTYQSGDDPAS